MKYTAKNLGDICSKILPATTRDFAHSKNGVSLPKLIDMCIVEMWVNDLALSFEETMILKRASKELTSIGYMTFEEDQNGKH